MPGDDGSDAATDIEDDGVDDLEDRRSDDGDTTAVEDSPQPKEVS